MSGSTGSGGKTVAVLAVVVVAAAAGIFFFLGRGGNTGAGGEAAAAAADDAWRARWASAKLPSGRDVQPDGGAGGFDAVRFGALDEAQARIDALRAAGAMRLVDPRSRRRSDVLPADALWKVSEGDAKPAVHPIEAAWLLRALCERVAKGCRIVELDVGVQTPLMLSRERYAVRAGDGGLGLDAADRRAKVRREVPDAEAAALWLIVRSHVARAQAQYEAAHADLAAADALAPGLPAIRFARGVLQIEQGVTEVGEASCADAVSAADDPMARLFLADVYTATDKPFKAFEMVEAANKRWPKLAEVHVARGMLIAGRIEKSPEAQRPDLIRDARAAFDQALQLDPGVAGAAAGLGQLELIAGNEAAAIARLKKAVTDSKDLDAASLLAQLLLSKQDTAGATEALRAVDRKDEERWWLLLVQALAMGGDGESALTEAQAAGRAFPESRQIRVLQAQLLRQLERLDEAVALMRPLAKDPGPGPQGANYAAMAAELMLQAGDIDGAIGALRVSLERDPKQKEAALLLVAALGRAGKMQERDAEIAKLLATGTPHEEIATLMLEIGDAEAAEQVLVAGVAVLEVGSEQGQRLVTLLAMLYTASGRKSAALDLKTQVLAKAGGADTDAGKALAKAVDDAIAGAEAELKRMAEPDPEGMPGGGDE